MRPRVFPAEDSRRISDCSSCPHRFNEAAGIPRGRRAQRVGAGRRQLASMRPRVFPAEDAEHAWRVVQGKEAASMRPRVFPAEDRSHHQRFRGRVEASMRPRVFPAEDV